MNLTSQKRRELAMNIIGALILAALLTLVIYSIGFLKNVAENVLIGNPNQQDTITRFNFEKLESLGITSKEPE